MHSEMGVLGKHYQFAAYQAVVADMMEGDTLHHFAGVGIGKASQLSKKKAMNNLRWLVIDAISQVSAELLADVEESLRVPMQHSSTYKVSPNGTTRNFGGVNVIYIGDFMQLPPVKATSLDSVPQSLFSSPYSNAGSRADEALELLWSSVNAFVELNIQERCPDTWYMSVQQECRVGNLSATNHQFLHGMPTGVPGSWVQSTGCASCELGCTDEVDECETCVAERFRRCRVFNSGIMEGRDTRMQEPEFKQAVAIVANNDLKDEICKRGMAQYARDTGQPLVWSYAVDKVLQTELMDDDDLRAKQNLWLQYPDNKCDGLIGGLPLAIGGYTPHAYTVIPAGSHSVPSVF